MRQGASPRLSACVAVLFLLLLAACDLNPSPVQSTPTGGSANTTSISNNPVAPRQPEATPTPAPPHLPSSYDKIVAAEKAGTLDHNHALVYELYAAVGDSRLPAEYKGDDSGLDVPTETPLREIHSRLAQTPSDLKEAMQPFFLRPENPESYWYKLNSAPSSGKAPGLAAPASGGPVYAVLGKTQHVKVWYVPAYGESNKHSAELALQWAEDIWGKETKLMGTEHQPPDDSSYEGGGGGPELDIYVCHTGVIDDQSADGETVVLNEGEACPCPSYILVSDRVKPFDTPAHKHVDKDTETRAVVAHEMFHAFQDGFPGSNYNPDQRWWWEASATWAEDYCYPDADTEQGYLFSWFGLYGPPALWQFGVHQSQYSNYLWAFYLVQQSGRPSIVRTIWDKMAGSGKSALQAVKESVDFEKRFNEFAVWGWDDTGGPSDKFRDHGQRIDATHRSMNPWQDVTAPEPDSGLEGKVELPIGREEDTPDDFLGQAQISYYRIIGRTPETKQLYIDWGNVAGAAVKLQALTKKRDQETYQPLRDWTKRTNYTFCYNRPDDDVDYIVLVITNPDIKNAAQGKIEVQARPYACELGNGQLHYTEHMSISQSAQVEGLGSANLERNSTEEVGSTLHVSVDTIEDDPQHTVSYVVTSTNRISVSGSAQGQQSGKDIFAIVGNADGNSTLSAQLGGGDTTHNPPHPGDWYYDSMKQEIEQSNAESGPDEQNNIEDFVSDLAGRLETWEENGQGHFRFSLNPLTQFLPQFTWRMHGDVTIHDTIISMDPPKVGDCTGTSDETYDNATGQTKSSSTSSCGSPENKTFEDQPIPMGFLNFYNRRQNQVDTQLEGTYDARSRVIDFTDSYSSGDCNILMRIDGSPLTEREQMLTSKFAPLAMAKDPPSCTIGYTVHLRIQLP